MNCMIFNSALRSLHPVRCYALVMDPMVHICNILLNSAIYGIISPLANATVVVVMVPASSELSAKIVLSS